MISIPKINLRKDSCGLQLIKIIIQGKGYLFMTVIIVNSLKSKHNRKGPFFFFENKAGALYVDTLGQINFFYNSSSH